MPRSSVFSSPSHAPPQPLRHHAGPPRPPRCPHSRHGHAPRPQAMKALIPTVGAARGYTLSLLDLCSRTNKNRRWETQTGAGTRKVCSGRPQWRRRGPSNARIPIPFNSQYIARYRGWVYVEELVSCPCPRRALTRPTHLASTIGTARPRALRARHGRFQWQDLVTSPNSLTT